MKQNKFPDNWDEERVKKVLAAYENQSEAEALAEDEAGTGAPEAIMHVPNELVPLVRELIARHRS